MKNKINIALISILLLISPIVLADFSKGVEAYNNKDYKTAFEQFKLLAEQGNSATQYNLAVMYENGIGIEQSNTKAVEWYKKAAEQGNSAAQDSLKNLKEYLLCQNNKAQIFLFNKPLACTDRDTMRIALKKSRS